jgi:hypothetical protein
LFVDARDRTAESFRDQSAPVFFAAIASVFYPPGRRQYRPQQPKLKTRRALPAAFHVYLK